MKNSKLALIFAVVTTLAAIVIRFFQYVSVIDYSTGFFTEGSGIAGYCVYLVFALTLALGITAAVIDKKRGSAAFEKSAATLSPSGTLLVGAAYIIGGIFFAFSAYNALSEGGFQLISMIILALSTFVIGFLLLSRKKIPAATGYLQLVPTIVLTCHAAVYFTSDLVIKRMSDELISMLADIIMVFLCLCFGRFLSNNEAKLTRRKTVAYAVTELALASSLTLGKLAAMLLGGDAAANMPALDCEYFGLLIISAAILAVLYGEKAVPTEDEEYIDWANKAIEQSAQTKE